jgi:hypothetical protein
MTIIRKLIAVVAVLGVGIALSASGAFTVATAEAAGPCASKSEFKKVKRGMDKYRVANILDTNGKLVSRFGAYSTRKYKTCSRFSSIMVDFKRGSVTSKSGFWF